MRGVTGAIHFRSLRQIPRHGAPVVATIYLQAHHLDLEFYDAFYKPGAYLRTHAEHMARWHEVAGYQI
jgi:hypothetical protein